MPFDTLGPVRLAPAETRRSGFEPIPGHGRICLDRGHNPPTHLFIPPGMRYRHFCPSCGHEVILSQEVVAGF